MSSSGEEANLSQEEVAQKVGVDRTTYCKWERGESTPPVGEERTKLAAQLDHLVELGRRENVTTQIVPYARGQYEALRIGKFSLLRHP